MSGGTDIAGALVANTPMTPIWDGEISARTLGVQLEAWDERGEPLIDAEGELVVTSPMPSMPLGLWGDTTGERYKEAYFSTYAGVWRQGDRITLTSRGTVLMHGRSDATLNRRGIRIGSSEIYDAIEELADISDSLVVGIEGSGGRYWMPLFVEPNETWDDSASRNAITRAIAARVSKHYIPDEIILTPAVPRTRTGKKMEVPVKRILMGADPAAIGATDATDQPEALRWFQRLAQERADRGL